MHSQEAPSTREVAEYLDKTDFADDSTQDAIKAALDHADIAALAHAMWESKGRPLGSDREDWFNAERKLKTNGRR
jgi:hypothetical protein